MTTARVLVMEYVDGDPVTDEAALRSRGIKPAAMAERTVELHRSLARRDTTDSQMRLSHSKC